MGQLARAISTRLLDHLPQGWAGELEACPFSRAVTRRLGFRPQVDVMLHHRSGRRILLELEISRADPSANQMKIAAGHLHEPLGYGDSLVSLCSNHIARGRQQLVASGSSVLRKLGIWACHGRLLPEVGAEQIKSWNHRDGDLCELMATDLHDAGLLGQLMLFDQRVEDDELGRLAFAPDLHAVLANAQCWSEQAGFEQSAWKARNATYFVWDGRGHLAPSKYCAYVSMRYPGNPVPLPLARYVEIAGSRNQPSMFDGNRARMHLERNLGMRLVALSTEPEILAVARRLQDCGLVRFDVGRALVLVARH